jgi:hypothetical protein
MIILIISLVSSVVPKPIIRPSRFKLLPFETLAVAYIGGSLLISF